MRLDRYWSVQEYGQLVRGGCYGPVEDPRSAAFSFDEAVLFMLLAALFAWARESGRVWQPTTRRRALLVATIAGALGLFPFYASWNAYHYSTFMILTYDWQQVMSGWQSSWQPPLRALIFAEPLPISIVSLPAPARELMLAPLAFVVAGLLRHHHVHHAHGVARALRIGFAVSLAALLSGVALAQATWQSGGPREGQNITAAGQYAMFATITLAVLWGAAAAAVVALRPHPARGSLAVLAALATVAGTALMSAIPPLIVLYGGCNIPSCLSTAWWRMSEASLAWTVTLGAPRAIVAACLAAAMGSAVVAALRTSVRTDSDEATPGVRRRRISIVLACLLAVLTTGNLLAGQVTP